MHPCIKNKKNVYLRSTIFQYKKKTYKLMLFCFRYLEVSTVNVPSYMTEELFDLAVIQVAEEVEEIDETSSVLDVSATGENVRKMIISSLIFN